MSITAGDIGDDPREYEVEPIETPEPVEVPEPRKEPVPV